MLALFVETLMKKGKLVTGLNWTLTASVLVCILFVYNLNLKYDSVIKNAQSKQTEDYAVQITPAESNDINVRSEIDELYSQIAEVRDILTNLDSSQVTAEAYAGSATNKQSSGNNAVTEPVTTEKSEFAEDSQAVKLFKQFTQLGYIYGKDWGSIGDRIIALDKDQNKVFWQNMFTAIEQGDVDIFDE